MTDQDQNSPTAHLVSLGFTDPASGSQSESDYGFSTLANDATPLSTAGTAGDPTPATTSIAAAMHGPATFDMLPSTPLQSGTGMPPNGFTNTPIAGRTSNRQQRPSMSNTEASRGMIRQSSFVSADSTSPDAMQNHANTGDNQGGKPGVGDTADGDGVPPAWSELKTKAGKDRKRLPLACIACRRKKIRCSGEKPACKHCLRSRIPCVYKVTTRKAAPRTDYMAMLDKRLKRMEDRVIKIIPKDQQHVVVNTGRAVVKPPLPPAPPKSAGSSKKRAVEQAFGDELEEWAATQQEAMDTRPNASNDKQTDPSTAKDPEEQSLLREGADKLPAKEIQEHLVEVFFDYVYGQSYHLLHKPSFMRRLASNSVPPVLMLAVCAISARFSSHPAVRTEPAFLRGENWASAARDIALRRYDTPNITILIVYLILGLHEFGTCQGGRSWMFGGMAQRMAYALQLHKDLDHDPKERSQSERGELTFTDREIRRRTMWSCFLMDRFNSSGTDRPVFVGEQYIRAQLPIKESLYQMEINGPTEDLEGLVPHPVEPGQGQMANAKDNMGVAAYLIRLVAIWGRLINYLNLGGKELDSHPMWSEQSKFHGIQKAVEDWRGALPESLLNTPENLQNYASEKIANQFIFLHIVYNQILLFMNRFALPTPGSRSALPKDMPEQFVAEAANTALDAANQISALINEAMDHVVVAPFAGYCAFFSSTVHIQGVFSKNAQLETSSKQNLAWNVKYLTKMKKYWGMFHFVTENLRDLYRRHADAARSGAKDAKDSDAAIFQYGDWFDRYPHGVSGTDYEEPSVETKKEPGSDAVLGQKSDLQTVEEFFSKLSPPSRAAQMQQQQAASTRKMAKKRYSRSEGSKPKQPAVDQNDQQQKQQQDLDGHGNVQHGIAHQIAHDLASTQTFQNTDSLSQLHSSFPAGFQQSHSDLSMATAPQLMSQLDRQMVLNSYTNNNHNNMQPNMSYGMFDNTGATPDNFDWTSLSSNTNQNGSGFWGDPSTAWFMPFNMNPPTIGEDSSMFGSNFDWSSNFPGFGDMSNMHPIDVDTGQMNGNSTAGPEAENLDHMQT